MEKNDCTTVKTRRHNGGADVVDTQTLSSGWERGHQGAPGGGGGGGGG